MIGNVFDFADRVAREVMVPRQDMVCLFLDDTLAENMAVVRSSHHTRYPLCMEDKDQVVGTLHVRDLLKIKPGQTTFDLRRLMRPIVVIPEDGGTAGLITMEDLVEEIVGDIQDEHEAQEPPDVLQLPDGRIEFDGMVLLDDVAEQLPIVFDDPEEDTIGGYVFGLLGRKPEIGDAVEISGYSFKVLRTEGFRVVRVLAAKLPQEQKQKEEQQDE